MITPNTYQQRDYSKLTGLTGISDDQIQVHLGLYAGYVKNTNLLNEKIAELANQGKTGTPEWAEMVRRLEFELNGLLLHEYYFSNLKSPKAPGPVPGLGQLTQQSRRNELDPSSKLGQAIRQKFGSIEDWLTTFKAVGAMRGVGWAILFQDPVTGWLSNHWITLHQDGNLAGFKPILVMDVWEHAFMVDYKPAERSKYIDAFFENVDWGVVEQRLVEEKTIR